MAQPFFELEQSSPWHQQALDNNERELNPVVTPYKDVDAKLLHDSEGIVIKKRLLTLKGGEQYWVTSSDLEKPVPHGLEGFAHYEGVAYTLHPEGLYVKRLIELGKLGISGSVFSIPENKGLFITYDTNVSNYLSLANNEALEHGRDPELVTTSNISQGSMNAFGFIEHAPEHGINVAAAHLDVPCLPDGIRPEHWKYLPGHIVETLVKLPVEVAVIVGAIMRMSKKERQELLPTVDLRPEALIVQGQMLPSLLSGSTGKAARNLPNTLPVVVKLGGLDALSRDKRWINSYIGDKDNVRIKRRRFGAHGDVVDSRAQASMIGFQGAVGEILTEMPSLRAHPEKAGTKILEVMREEYPQYTKPLAA